jgi:hypothetical protein
MAKARGEEHRHEATETPVPGRYYIVGGIKQGEGLSHMAAAAYGDGKRWREIWRPNKKIARSSDPNRSFIPGDVIWIPGDYIEEEKVEDLRDPVAETLTDADTTGIQLIIDGTVVPVLSGQVLVTFDTAADGWVATVQTVRLLRVPVLSSHLLLKMLVVPCFPPCPIAVCVLLALHESDQLQFSLIASAS